MPYIKKERRTIISGTTEPLTASAGDYVYHYYKIMVRMWKENPRFETAYLIKEEAHNRGLNFNLPGVPPALQPDFPKYSHAVLLQLAWEEFRRRYLSPYEDEKLKENGDVE